MAERRPKLSERLTDYQTFSAAVCGCLKEKKLTQADLQRKSGLSKTTVSRICRNNNDKGSTYLPTYEAVMAVCVGLGLNEQQAWDLFCLAFPELPFWKTILKYRMNLHQANELLYDNGCRLLGNTTED